MTDRYFFCVSSFVLQQGLTLQTRKQSVMDEYKELFWKSAFGFGPLLVTVGLVSIKPFEVRVAMFDSWFRWVILAAAIWTAFGFLWCIDTVVDIIKMEFKYLVIRTIGRSGNKYIREIAYFLEPMLLPESRAEFYECRSEARSGDPDKADKMCDLGFRYAHGRGCRKNYRKAHFWYEASYINGLMFGGVLSDLMMENLDDDTRKKILRRNRLPLKLYKKKQAIRLFIMRKCGAFRSI